MAGGKDFVFIDQSHQGKVSNNKATRRQIRVQAMRDAGLARRQRGGYGFVLSLCKVLVRNSWSAVQHNLRQYPRFMDSGDSTSPLVLITTDKEEIDARYWHEWHGARKWTETIPTRMPIGGYERLRRDLDFNVTELSLLTSHSFGLGAARAVASHPAQLAGMLLSSNSSYLNFVPSRCEDNPLLRDVLWCTAAQSRWLLRPQSVTAEASILASYGNALQRLQKALTDPEQCLHPDVLCATQMLGLFEVLKFSRPERWQYHVAGAAQIIQARGPSRFKLEYEKCLFMSMSGALFTEAMLNNEACFLDEDQWKPVFDDLILNNVGPFADRSRLCIELWCVLHPIARVWKSTTELVCHREDPDPALAMELTLKVYAIRDKLKEWFKKAESLVTKIPTSYLLRAESWEVMGLCLAARLIVDRLIVSLSPRTSLAIEQEVQDIANSILAIKRDAHKEPGSRSLLLSQRFVIANSAIQTHKEWKQACRNIVASATTATSEEWEGESRDAIEDIHELDRTEVPEFTKPRRHRVCEGHVAESVISTADECWIATLEAARAEGSNGNDGGPIALPDEVQRNRARTVIPKWVFETWCDTLGRKTG